MKRFLTATAAIALLSAPALAESHASGEMTTMGMTDMQGDLIRARDIIGGTIYTTDATDSWDPTTLYEGIGTDWEDIGEIEDLVMTQNGELTGIVAEVGGFLDIADKHVVISVDDVSLVAVDDQTYAYVTRLSEEQLEELDGVDEGFWN